MYPGFISWWSRERCGARRGGIGFGAEPGSRHGSWHYSAGAEEDPAQFGFGGGAFGVRRPLRFLAYKLQLREEQVSELARILDELKTERAQAAVDHRRALSAFADAIAGEVFEEAKANAGAALRLQTAERLRGAVVSALSRIHKLLHPQQRARLAYLIRTGTLAI